MVLAHASAAYRAKVTEFNREMHRVWATLHSNPSLEEALHCFQVCDDYMRFWETMGFPEEQELCRRQLAASRPEMERIYRLAQKLLARAGVPQ